jgi:hypothetical protein
MPGRRPIRKGSFGAHFDEVVKHFHHAAPSNGQQQSAEAGTTLREKLDIHAQLFERAWQLDREHLDKRTR